MSRRNIYPNFLQFVSDIGRDFVHRRFGGTLMESVHLPYNQLELNIDGKNMFEPLQKLGGITIFVSEPDFDRDQYTSKI